MSNKNWTPGPWVAHGPLVYFANVAGGLWVDATPNPEANAHLISSAPELYEALESVLPYVVMDTTECRGDKCRDAWCISCCGEESAQEAVSEINQKVEAAIAALAKARGDK